MDPVVTRRNNRRKGCRRNFLRGGGSADMPLNGAYTVGGPLVPGLGNASVINPVSACMAAARPMPSFSGSAGIPGIGGAMRRRKHRGGRYEISMETTPNGIALTNATAIPCERGSSPTISTSPLFRGGAGAPIDQAISVSTAGYTEKPSDFLSASGTPLMLHVPVNGRSCGGSRRRHRRASRKASRKSRKASRKSHKASRKSRKASRKSRKASRKSRRN